MQCLSMITALESIMEDKMLTIAMPQLERKTTLKGKLYRKKSFYIALNATFTDQYYLPLQCI